METGGRRGGLGVRLGWGGEGRELYLNNKIREKIRHFIQPANFISWDISQELKSCKDICIESLIVEQKLENE